MKKIENERTAEKRVTFTEDYNKKEDQAMDPDNGITIKTLLIDPIPIMASIFRTVDGRLTNGQINSPTETMEIDRIMGISILKVELGEITEIFLVHNLDRDGNFLKANLFAEVNLFNVEIHHLEDRTITQTLVPLLTNKNLRKPTIKHQRTWFASPPLMIALTKCRNFVH